ncbi:hypothetical protein GGTG_08772 [Gaeumannomyces tritici R3-111a-1]|uniref:Uncharacterized protein n=1 Tax=Gaeumannomyces tritici (strain R3-111a-1) TaxID=644352 RepID=J3P5I3_GAET3|nr:hypothetical protein GGTG_08772 [Gaeumannomyces tritici R3-111a-1]EJT74934.1 hypothetical protein GGTG_08772 [Gaeumannomyces tritici R3-111a-1]
MQLVTLALGAYSTASFSHGAPRPVLGPLSGTDPRILNGTCPSTDKNTTCEAPHPAQLKELACDKYDSASRRDLDHEILLRQKWLLNYDNGKHPLDSLNLLDCPVPAQTCRRFACARSTGLFVCNHNAHNVTLNCGREVDAVANKINDGCCTRKGTWSSDGVSGHYTTDQGWKVVVAYANCAGEQDWDAVVPNKTGAGVNGVCETANDGLSDRDGISSKRWEALPAQLWPTLTYEEGKFTTGTAHLTANSTTAPRTTATSTAMTGLARLNTTTTATANATSTTAPSKSKMGTVTGEILAAANSTAAAAASLSRGNNTVAANTTATAAPSSSKKGMRPAVVTALATSVEGAEAQVTGEILPTGSA